MAGEIEEQLVLARGEGELAPRDPDAAVGGIDAEVARREHGDGIGGAAAAQQCLHTQLQLAHGEGLGEVVVSAVLEPVDAVVDGTRGR